MLGDEGEQRGGNVRVGKYIYIAKLVCKKGMEEDGNAADCKSGACAGSASLACFLARLVDLVVWVRGKLWGGYVQVMGRSARRCFDKRRPSRAEEQSQS